MSKITITSNEKVNLPIFNDPEIQEKTKQLFNSMQEDIYARFEELISYLNVEPVNEFSYENILKHFECQFFYEILGLAVEIALTTPRYNMKENLLSCIAEGNLIKAIMHEPMIEAFKDVILSTPAKDAYDHAHRGCMIYNLETMNDEEYFDGNSEQKCTVKRDDEAAKEFIKDFNEYLKDDIDE